ncbi:ParM/StbA family protein [Brevibacillus borstelensis]|uniref:ParM/StbA family protein n=1 Tax=Brevibacillus borstelensis TaxID=45462 RepID=UPI002E211EFF|nr:ParM/StbA family protein [Brevibacillus borstelensis]
MHNKFLIAIDSGKSSTKAVMREDGIIHRIKFPTRVEQVSDFGAEVSPGSFLVEYEGKSFLIGSMLDESKMNFDLSKNNEQHRLCIYLAITNLLLKSKRLIGFSDISLAINIPLLLYKNETQKKAYHDSIRNNGETICITVNNKAFVFRISQLLLLPEGMGNVYTQLNEYRSKKALMIDIGSLNINYLEFNNLVPNYEKMLTADLGINILRSKIADSLSSKYGISVSDSDAERLFTDKYLIMDGVKREESKEIIEQIIQKHVQEIFNFAKSRKLTFNNVQTVFSGGGSILLSDYIADSFPAAIFATDSQFANVLSFLRILETKYGQAA